MTSFRKVAFAATLAPLAFAHAESGSQSVIGGNSIPTKSPSLYASVAGFDITLNKATCEVTAVDGTKFHIGAHTAIVVTPTGASEGKYYSVHGDKVVNSDAREMGQSEADQIKEMTYAARDACSGAYKNFRAPLPVLVKVKLPENLCGCTTH